MSVKETAYSTLANDSAVAALVATRIYPVNLPQDCTLPAVKYQLIGGIRDFFIDGPSRSGRARIRFDCWGATSDAAWGLYEAVRDAVDGLTAAYPVMAPVEFYDAEGQAYRVSVDYSIYHQEV